MHHFQGEQHQHTLILEPGEKIIESLTQFAEKNNLNAYSISGIGAIKNVDVGFYHLETGDYEHKVFDQGDFELISLTGNTSIKDNEPYVHIHTSFSDESFRVWGGHLFEAEVAVTAEILCLPMAPAKFHRQLDPRVGLQTICKLA